ncbi:FAD-dependent oxidoreductase [Nocardiopsis algeriensis]|uniref:FAD-dependent oxidoreductase n=1 Tax=Nocardiopsis algeriensis TaxID=1478215 RepID=UPI003B43553D
MTRVVVVGAGPVGLAAALAAARRGMDVTVAEAGSAGRVRPGSRAVFVHRASLEALERIRPGLGADLAAAGITWSVRRTLWAGRTVYRRSYAVPGAGLPPFTSLPQSMVEEHLVRACGAAGVRIAWDTRVTGIRSSPAAVALETRSGPMSADRVIAADGPRSTVRARLGIRLDGSSPGGDFVVVDVAGTARSPELERVFHYRHPGVGGRNVLLVPFRGGHRIDLQCRDEEEAERFAADARPWVEQVLGGHDITWVSRYRFRRRVAERFTDRHGRVLLAGEAAHLFPPFGARGMNSGITDAVAAAEAVATGDAYGYGAERRRAALANRAAAAAAHEHLAARTWKDRARQRGAALLAPVSRRAGRWLDSAPFGPPLARVSY